MASIILYTTAGCHLCEQAKALLWPVMSSQQLRLKEIDIADSDEMIERYGVRIPVIALSKGNTGAELNWPFDSEELLSFVKRNHSRGGI